MIPNILSDARGWKREWVEISTKWKCFLEQRCWGFFEAPCIWKIRIAMVKSLQFCKALHTAAYFCLSHQVLGYTTVHLPFSLKYCGVMFSLSLKSGALLPLKRIQAAFTRKTSWQTRWPCIGSTHIIKTQRPIYHIRLAFVLSSHSSWTTGVRRDRKIKMNYELRKLSF